MALETVGILGLHTEPMAGHIGGGEVPPEGLDEGLGRQDVVGVVVGGHTIRLISVANVTEGEAVPPVGLLGAIGADNVAVHGVVPALL